MISRLRRPQKSPLLIIGAGITGLSLANALAGRYQITILEAQTRTGGRIRSLGNRMEAGPEFVHGNLPLTSELVNQAGATLEKTEGKWYRVSNCEWKENDEVVEGWDAMLENISQIPEDITLDAFLETHFGAPDHEQLRRHARAFASGFDLADPVKASIKALAREWSNQPGSMYRIKEGYASLITYLEKQCVDKGCIILTNKKVKQIDWQKGAVAVYTDTGDRFHAEKLIVTLPAGVLQRKMATCSVNLTPSLDNYEQAWQQIGFGSVMKILLRFKQAFWKDQHKNIGFILSDEAIPSWWTQLPSKQPLLTGWVGGPSALQWDRMSKETIIEHAVNVLVRLFRMTAGEIIDQLEEHHIFRWHNIETACGGYSYATPQSDEALQILNTPIDGTVYFAGESLYRGPHPGTVEAALHNAYEVAEKLVAPSRLPRPGISLFG
jgi:monoamine oxidase